ncbi:hypothetical protein C8Q75DRAFT_723072 [Abortiporus biennis]|nr:hypothetical protein C8Q75DRAFT_723072 [Abortiporus biennis]
MNSTTQITAPPGNTANGTDITTTTSNIITFPGGNATATDTFSDISTITSSSATDIPTGTPVIPSQFTFLTQSSLLVASSLTPTETPSVTLTNPDEPTSSVSVDSTAAPAADNTAPPPPAALPTTLPSQIVPANGVDPGVDNLDGYTPIAILYSSDLRWEFVAKNPDSASQIFAWTSASIQYALSLTTDQVQLFALEAWRPSDYTGPSDIDKLLTLFVAYIPSDQVNNLAQQIKVKSSAFYQVPQPAGQISTYVNPGFPVTAVSTNNDAGDGTTITNNTSGSATSASGSSSKTRENVIIGVVTSLGAVTLLVLAFLVVRAVKQRRELAHRRLSDPPQGFVGARPENQDFDRDSVGGARRRSFYYAEDSLRGFSDIQPQPQQPGGAGMVDEYDHRVTEGMRERRPVNAGMISTPILRDNTMNW